MFRGYAKLLYALVCMCVHCVPGFHTVVYWYTRNYKHIFGKAIRCYMDESCMCNQCYIWWCSTLSVTLDDVCRWKQQTPLGIAVAVSHVSLLYYLFSYCYRYKVVIFHKRMRAPTDVEHMPRAYGLICIVLTCLLCAASFLTCLLCAIEWGLSNSWCAPSCRSCADCDILPCAWALTMQQRWQQSVQDSCRLPLRRCLPHHLCMHHCCEHEGTYCCTWLWTRMNTCCIQEHALQGVRALPAKHLASVMSQASRSVCIQL